MLSKHSLFPSIPSPWTCCVLAQVADRRPCQEFVFSPFPSSQCLPHLWDPGAGPGPGRCAYQLQGLGEGRGGLRPGRGSGWETGGGSWAATGGEGPRVGFVGGKLRGGEQSCVTFFSCHARGLMWCQPCRDEEMKRAEQVPAQWLRANFLAGWGAGLLRLAQGRGGKRWWRGRETALSPLAI